MEDPQLLEMAFGRGLLEGHAEWKDVPEVVRRSFLLVAKELRRLRRLVAANLPDPALQRQDPAVHVLQDQLVAVRTQLQHMQDEADARHRRTNQKLSNVWGEVAATAKAAADAQTQQMATSERLAANWEAAQTQLQLLERRMKAQQDRRIKAKRTQDDQVLHDLQKSRVLSDHQVMGTTVQANQDEAQDEKRPGRSKAEHILLHQHYVEALKRTQDGGGLSPVAEDD